MRGKPRLKPKTIDLWVVRLYYGNVAKLLSKLKHLFKLNIVTEDILITVFLLIIFGAIYLSIPKKLSDSTIISPLQKENLANTEMKPALNLENKEVIGFLPSWTVSANTEINIKKLTQLIYFGLSVAENGDIVKYDDNKNPTLEWHYFNSDKFTSIMKEAKKNKTKVMISFKMFNNEITDNLISNSGSTNYFIKQVIALLKQYDLDGINLDIEYFTDSDFPTARHLNSFLVKVTDALRKSDSKYKVSIDVNATVVLRDSAYDMVKIGEVADEIILMAYDYRVPASQRVGPAAPINGLVNEHSITESINSLAGRVPMEKIILGIPLYGYEWQTLSKNHKSTAVPGSGALATYKRVQELLETRVDLNKHWDEEAMSPWLVYIQSGAIKQIYYEDERSLQAKIDFVKSKNLGGVSLWALGYEGKYENVWDLFDKK